MLRRPAATSAARWPWMALAVLGALLVIVLLRTAWLCDDAFITYRVVDNAIHGYGLRWNVVERVQVFTHPLWLMLLLPIEFITREFYFTPLVVCVACSLGAVAVGARALGSAPRAVLLLALLISSKAWTDYATAGLESPLAFLLLAWFLSSAAPRDDAPRRVERLALATGLVILTRADLGLVVLPALAVELWTVSRTRAMRAALVGAAPVAAWSAFALVYYGFVAPNTAVAKLGSGIPRGELIAQGLAYLRDSLVRDPVTLGVLALGIAAGLAAPRTRALAVGVALYVAYIVWIGGDFMSGRFLAAPVFAAAWLLAQSTRLQAGWRAPALGALALSAGLLAPHPPLTSGRDAGAHRSDILDATGIADERAFYFGQTGLINGQSDQKPASGDVRDGRGARDRRDPLAVRGAVGVFGFYAGPGVTIVDEHALGDAFLARLPMVAEDAAYREWYAVQTGHATTRAWRIGHFRRAIPAGYLGLVLGQPARFDDARLGEFAQRLQVVTRGPLLSGARLAEIVRFHVGAYSHLVDRSHRPAFVRPRWEEVIAARPDFQRAYAALGERQIREGHKDEAMKTLAIAVEKDPRDPIAAYNLGLLSLEAGDRVRALAMFERAVSVEPDSVAAQTNLASCYNDAGRYGDAVRAAAQAVSLAPQSVEAHFNLGTAQFMLGDLGAALAEFRAVTRLDPRLAAAYERIAVIHEQRGEQDLALAAWRDAARLGSPLARTRLPQ